MPEADFPGVSALAGHINAGVFGAADAGAPAVTLSERRPSAILQLSAGAADTELKTALSRLGIAAMPASNRALNAGDLTVLWSGPGRWLVVDQAGTGLDGDALRAEIESTGGALTDLSQARSVIRISGERTTDVLLKGCPLDLETFPVDGCAASLLSHVSVQLHRADDKCFDVYVFRSFGLALWEWLLDASLEFGVEVISPQPD